MLQVNTMYKPKGKKVQLVNISNRTGDTPSGRRDQYLRSKERNIPQEYVSKYKDYLLPRTYRIPRGSRLTPERLKQLNIRKWLLPKERGIFNEIVINYKLAITFDQ